MLVEAWHHPSFSVKVESHGFFHCRSRLLRRTGTRDFLPLARQSFSGEREGQVKDCTFERSLLFCESTIILSTLIHNYGDVKKYAGPRACPSCLRRRASRKAKNDLDSRLRGNDDMN